MRFAFALTAAALSGLLSHTAAAAPLKVVTWNLGWHLSQAETRDWIAACSAPFALDNGTWKPAASATADTKPGWELPWGRNAPVQWDIGVLPPCDIYQANRAVVPITEAAYATRVARIGSIVRDQLKADVIAFQEVSGAPAVRELLGQGFEVCSYEGHKVQRLAIAWKKSLGAGRCAVEWPLSLPQRALRDQVRPGLSLALNVDGKPLKVLTVHLKSSCVSPFDERAAEGRGQLDSAEPNCVSLQQQVAPLEAWVDREAADGSALVLLGDFNRNLAHEASEPSDAAARSAGGSATDPHGPGVKVRSLWRELNDGQPVALRLLDSQCTPDVDAPGLCKLAKSRNLEREQMNALRSGEALGCRNPLGLDHIVVGGPVQAPEGAFKHPLGRLALTLTAKDGREAQLGVSDHCPLGAVVEVGR
jgi:endonuclease/exonuclease/phosphatase family metal-dependent hydrolase